MPKGNTSLNVPKSNLDLNPKPTNVRWRVFIMLLLLVTINYVDRAVLSIAMPEIQKDLSLDPAIVGLILSSFFWGYALMQVPSGWLADRYRPDKVVYGAAISWGIVQTLTGFIMGAKSLMFLRVLLGITEAPVMPGSSKLQSIWLSSKERGRGATIIDSGAPLGTAVGGPIIIAFMAWFGGWRGALIGAGILTIIIAWLVWRVIKGGPEGNPKVNEAEREYIRKALEEEYEEHKRNSTGIKIGAKDYLKARNFWCMCLGWFSFNTVFYGLMTWGPSYLAVTQDLDIAAIGGSVLIIFGCGFIGEIIGGLITDKWRDKGGSINTVMRTMLSIAGIMTALSIFFLTKTTSVTMAITMLSIALFFLRWGGLYWAVPAAISQREHVGTIGGCMNLAGNLAGVLTPIYIGIIVSVTGSYFLALMVFVAAGILLAIVSSLIRYNKKIGSEKITV
ncbi:MFS transporter [Mesobacillus maritimus]|uniref:MFS transporter n=1 Tax=Mesobacillus maritimus TaxID=1643336 RepID=UPI0020425F43|nr:MFS transporter [Mesobacillus maritimus]MCM3587855.1 MFS transporter [Mesobacillus maritimus]MCM3671784.1 MFS transporter [Mesobacillus maritimus]